MRLCLATKDYIRTQIISKKISTRFFEDGKNDELKLKFYQWVFILKSSENGTGRQKREMNFKKNFLLLRNYSTVPYYTEWRAQTQVLPVSLFLFIRI